MSDYENPLATGTFCPSCDCRMSDNAQNGTPRIVAVCPLCGWTEAKK